MEATIQKRWKTRRRGALALLYVSFVLWGADVGLQAGIEPGKLPSEFFWRVNLLLAIPLSLASLWFCVADAKLAGKTLVEMARLGIFFLWPIGVPIYLLWARNIRGLGVVLLHGILLCLVGFSSALITMILLICDSSSI